MKIVAFALLAGALATSALAADPVGQPESKPTKPHLICKRDRDTGSHMTKSVCKTAVEWAATRVDSDRNKIDTQNHF